MELSAGKKNFRFVSHFSYGGEIWAWPAPRFFIAEILEINRRSAQISKITRFSRFCRILLILKSWGAEIRNFRKIFENVDFRHFGTHICRRSDYRPEKFLVHFWAIQHIQPPYSPKSQFSKRFRKYKDWCESCFNMSKIRQNLENLVQIEIWAILTKIAFFLIFQAILAENAL